MTDLITEARELCELRRKQKHIPMTMLDKTLELCDALEKAERESGCEWCADNYDHRHKTMFRKGSDWNYEAKYCDMCGKRLEAQHE